MLAVEWFATIAVIGVAIAAAVWASVVRDLERNKPQLASFVALLSNDDLFTSVSHALGFEATSKSSAGREFTCMAIDDAGEERWAVASSRLPDVAKRTGAFRVKAGLSDGRVVSGDEACDAAFSVLGDNPEALGQLLAHAPVRRELYALFRSCRASSLVVGERGEMSLHAARKGYEIEELRELQRCVGACMDAFGTAARSLDEAPPALLSSTTPLDRVEPAHSVSGAPVAVPLLNASSAGGKR